MKTTAFIIICIILLLCGILLVLFEKKNTSVKKIVLISVMTALSVAGRFIFAPFPGFKPVTAIVILTGMYLGVEAGFFCGSLTALISNFYFGQGPWTPFQMLVWGLIGIIAALCSNTLKKSKLFLAFFGALSGVAFSLIMDIYTVIWTTGHWSFSFYVLSISAALPYTIIYAVSNIIFILALSRPVGAKLNRAIKKSF